MTRTADLMDTQGMTYGQAITRPVTLSVCIMTKNEAHRIGKAIGSIRSELPDAQIVVLDTGSDDGTPQVAADSGADVVLVDRDYTRVMTTSDGEQVTALADFAWARNRMIDAASGEWIFQFDADHALAPGSGQVLMEAITRYADHPVGIHVYTHEAASEDADIEDVVSGKTRQAPPWEPLCIFPRMVGGDVARYERRVHERIDRWLQAHGVTEEVTLPIHVVHVGGIESLRHKERRNVRNQALLESCLQEDPTDIESASYLAFDFYHAGKYGKAFEVAQAGLPHAKTKEHRHPAHKLLRIAALCLVEFAEQQEDRQAMVSACSNALSALQTAEQIYPHPDVHCTAATIYEMLDRPVLALSQWSMARAMRPMQDMVVGGSSWSALAGMGRCEARLGELEAAATHLVDALDHKEPHFTDEIRAHHESALLAVRAEWLARRTAAEAANNQDTAPLVQTMAEEQADKVCDALEQTGAVVAS